MPSATFYHSRANIHYMNTSDAEWSKIVNAIAPDLYRFFLGSFSNHQASDLVQETLIRLVKKCQTDEFDPTLGSIKNYSFGIAHFVRLEALKKRPDYHLVDDPKELNSFPAELHDANDEAAHLRWAISQLKPIEQQIILQMIDEESTFDQIASDFAMPVGTVKSHVHRAKEKLKQLMEIKP